MLLQGRGQELKVDIVVINSKPKFVSAGFVSGIFTC